jgi:hypothetical protein
MLVCGMDADAGKGRRSNGGALAALVVSLFVRDMSSLSRDKGRNRCSRNGSASGGSGATPIRKWPMKLPKKTLRAIMLLPDDFCGEVRFCSNGHGSFILEVKHQQRFVAKGEEMIDLTPDMAPGGPLELRTPRRG